MTDDRLQKVSRLKNLKESLQEQAEWQLANAMAEMRECEASVAEVEHQKKQLHETAAKLSAAELHNRMVYGEVLAQELRRRQTNLTSARSDVARYREELQTAYVETNRWTRLEDWHSSRVEQERTQQSQRQADELALQRYGGRQEEL